jgi:hypothetical protein
MYFCYLLENLNACQSEQKFVPKVPTLLSSTSLTNPSTAHGFVLPCEKLIERADRDGGFFGV